MLSHFAGAEPRGDKTWQAKCPAHDDNKASLSITQADDRWLLYCHAGCLVEHICDAARLKFSDLFNRRSIVRMYDYRDEYCVLLYQVVKYLPKDFRQRRPDGKGGWVWNMQGVRLVPYRLSELLKANDDRPNDWRFVVEGEKDVDRLASVGLVATCNVGGAGKWRIEYNTPFKGQRVCIIADKDAAGRDHAQKVAASLQGVAAEIRIIELPGDRVKDASDYFDAGGTADSLLSEVEQASARADEDNDLDFVPFPTDELPAPLAAFTREAALALICDESAIAVLLLVALASAIGNSRRVRVKADWFEPAILWAMLVALTGSKKTHILNAVMQFVFDRQRKLREEFEQEVRQYEIALVEWNAKRKEQRPPEKPAKPVFPHVWVSDVTVEALAGILEYRQRGLILFRDELNAWFRSFNQYRGGAGSDEQAYLPMYNAAPLKVDRASVDRPSKYVPRASVSITGGIQPDVLRESFTPERIADGLAGRFLFIFPPEPDAPAWTDATISPDTKNGVRAIFDFLYGLDFDRGEPMYVHLSPEATAIFKDFANELKVERKAMGNVPLAGAWAKFEAIPARLALILEMVNDAIRGCPPPPGQTQYMPPATMESAVRITRWLMNESRRIYRMLGHAVGNPRGQLIGWVREQGGRVTARDLQRHSRKYPNSEAATTALDQLVSAGLGRWEVTQAPGASGGRPAMVFAADADKTSNFQGNS